MVGAMCWSRWWRGDQSARLQLVPLASSRCRILGLVAILPSGAGIGRFIGGSLVDYEYLLDEAGSDHRFAALGECPSDGVAFAPPFED
jgi:hypothetical protein